MYRDSIFYIDKVTYIHNRNYGNSFPFCFVANWTIKKCVENGEDLVHRYIEHYINRSLVEKIEKVNFGILKIKDYYKDVEYKRHFRLDPFESEDMEPEERTASIYFMAEPETTPDYAKNLVVSGLSFNFNRGVKDIADEYLAVCDKWIKKVIKNRYIPKNLRGD